MRPSRPSSALLCAAVLWAAALPGQAPNATPQPPPPVQAITLQAHAERLPLLARAVESCLQSTALCQGRNAIANETFSLPNGVRTTVDYTWLRDGMAAMEKANPQDRDKLATRLLSRLRATETPEAPPVAERDARAQADAVLAQVEFAKSRPNLLQQAWQRFTAWLNRRIVSSPSAHNALPWLQFLLEAALFGVPLLLLGLWLLRQVQEDRVRPATARDQPIAGTPAEPLRWRDIAEAHARAGQWRDAVHALYWQSIAAFEQRRVLSIVRHRTPREYLRLLEAGSARRTRLRELTLLLERVWYGSASATEADFQRAGQLAEELATA